MNVTAPVAREEVRVVLLTEIENARHNGRHEEEKGFERALACAQERWDWEDQRAAETDGIHPHPRHRHELLRWRLLEGLRADGYAPAGARDIVDEYDRVSRALLCAEEGS